MTVPLEEDATAALVVVQRALAAPIVLIGAAGLGCHIPMKWRRTEDLDLVVALPIDDAARALGSLTGWSQNRRKEHEWRSPRGVLIDLLPVSRESLASGILVWPASGNQMSLVGMRHALSSPQTQVDPGLAIAVPSVPIISLLKMVSYLDRPSERERDLSDLAHILDEYPSADDDRLFDSGIYEQGLAFETAMAFILGRELAALADVAEAEVVRRFLHRVRSSDLGRFVANGPWSIFEPEQAESRLDALELGFRSAGEPGQ